MGSVQIKGGQIVDSAIVAAKLASNAVTSAKLADGAIPDRDWETRVSSLQKLLT